MCECYFLSTQTESCVWLTLFSVHVILLYNFLLFFCVFAIFKFYFTLVTAMPVTIVLKFIFWWKCYRLWLVNSRLTNYRITYMYNLSHDSWFLHSKPVQILINTVRSIGIFTIWLVSNTQCKVDFYSCVFSNTLYVVVFFIYFYFFPFLFTGLLLEPYGLIYSARIVCIEHCLDVNNVCITVCEELNDDDDDDSK